MYQAQRRNGKPEVYAQEVLPSRVPGDIIKERVEEKPTLERLNELVGKRYRFKPEHAGKQLQDFMYPKAVDDALSMATLKEAVTYIVNRLVKHDGNDRNLIKTAAEVNEDKVFQNKKMILITILGAINSGQTRADMLVSVSRQLAMRKLTQYRAEPVISDILNVMVQDRLIEQTQVSNAKGNGLASLRGVVIQYGITEAGKQKLAELKGDTFDDVSKAAVDSIKIYQNFMPQ